MPERKEKAVILLGFLPDPRINKRIEFEKNLFDLTLICWDRGNNTFFMPTEDGYKAYIVKIEAKNDPLKRIGPYLKFSSKVRQILEEIQPQIVDVQGLDMLEIAMSYKKKHINSVKVIYEVADLHRLLVDKQKNPIKKIAQSYLRNQDKILCEKIDLLIVTSEKYVDKYFKELVPEEKIMLFPNVLDLDVFAKYKSKEHSMPLTVGYIGGIRYKEQIKNLLSAAQSCGVNVLLAGYEVDNDEIEKISEKMPNVEWVGKFDFNRQAAELYSKCDIIYSVYNADMANVRVALPNKLYESIYCELPIIVAENTYLSELVKKWGVGIAVNHKNKEDLIEALQDFKDNPEVFHNYALKCKEKKYLCDLKYYNDQLKEIISNWFDESIG